MKDRPVLTAWLIALAFFVLRFAFAGQADLAEDEAYYWEWSRSLDWSYYDQGPMLALAIRFGTWLLGRGEQGVRLAALLGGLGISGVAIRITAFELGRPKFAPWVALAFNSMLLFAAGGVLMMHDSLLGLFWSLALLAALQARRDPRWWLAAGAAAGLGFLSKYTGVLLFLCLGAYALARREERTAVGRNGWFWAGGALGSLAALPVLLWNRANGWPSFQHVGSLAGGDSSRRSWGAPFEFAGSQLGLVTPILLGLIVAAWIWVWRRRRSADGGLWLLFCASAPVALFFAVLSLRSRIEGNWPAPAYLGGLLLVGAWLAQAPERARLSRWAVALALAVSTLVHVQVLWPFLPLPASQPKLDSAARIDGWRELGQRVQAERAALGASFVAARTYQNAAVLGFYTADQSRALIIQDGVINHQYRFWNQPSRHAGQNAVLVVGQDWELNEMAPHFSRLERRPDHVHIRNGVEVRRTQIYRAWGFKPQLGA